MYASCASPWPWYPPLGLDLCYFLYVPPPPSLHYEYIRLLPKHTKFAKKIGNLKLFAKHILRLRFSSLKEEK